MRRPRLFCDSLCEGQVSLSPEEAHHARTSLRLTAGNEVVLFDGAGGESAGEIARIDRKGVVVDAGSMTRRPFELAYRVTLAIALGRAHRQGYVIEKCTELGVAAIWPVVADRSVSRPGGDAARKWSRRAIEAAKQAGRAWIPSIADSRTFAEALECVTAFDATCLTCPAAPVVDTRKLEPVPFAGFLAALPESSSVLVWVGPEGGWSESEQTRAIEAGAVAATLGPTMLRTETAAVAVCAAAAMVSAERNVGGADD